MQVPHQLNNSQIKTLKLMRINGLDELATNIPSPPSIVPNSEVSESERRTDLTGF
jgi:hypothetical protein